MKNIASALVKAQKAFGPALKTSTNPHFKSRYADLSACVEAVIEGLNNNGVMLMQQCHVSDSGVTVETVFIHESGETMSAGMLHVPASKQDPQGYGSALTYARRYSLMAACGIAPEDDDGNAATRSSAKHVELVESKKSIAQDHFDKLDKEEQEFLRQKEVEITTADDLLAAYEEVKKSLDAEEQLALWSLLPSPIRTRIKKEGAEKKAA